MVVRIHPGQSPLPISPLAAPLLLPLLTVTVLAAAPPAAQGTGVAPSRDSLQVLREARDAQARFERVRRRRSPEAPGGWGGSCDEIVGRMCLRLQPTGDWWPEPEPPELVDARTELLEALEEAGRALPGDGWILGQAVVYLVEAGRSEEALARARRCGPADESWCDALAGYVLHTQHRYLEAEGAFRKALAGMDGADARRWTDPLELLDGEGRGALGRASPGELETLRALLWEMADPLFLVEGNDRWTEHLARQVVVRAREDAANPYNLRWGNDLAETVLRYGWEVGWERVEPRPPQMSLTVHAVGHQHPESRPHIPPGAALTSLGVTRPDVWNPGSRFLPHTGYAPQYAPVFLPADAEIHRAPRGDSLVVVALLALPADTTYHREHGHDPLPIPEAFRGRPAEVGLFAQQGGALVAGHRRPGVRGTVRIALAPGEYLLSAEVWAPDSARAGRVRQGLVWTGVPRDLPTASDLFLADAGGGEPGSLEELLDRLRPGLARPGEVVRVGWELHGFGFRRETLGYRLEIREAAGGLLRRMGRLLGLTGEGRALSLAWSEAGPESPGPFFRSAEVSIPADLDPGAYIVLVRVESAGRETLVLERPLNILPPSR